MVVRGEDGGRLVIEDEEDDDEDGPSKDEDGPSVDCGRITGPPPPPL